MPRANYSCTPIANGYLFIYFGADHSLNSSTGTDMINKIHSLSELTATANIPSYSRNGCFQRKLSAVSLMGLGLEASYLSYARLVILDRFSFSASKFFSKNVSSLYWFFPLLVIMCSSSNVLQNSFALMQLVFVLCTMSISKISYIVPGSTLRLLGHFLDMY